MKKKLVPTDPKDVYLNKLKEIFFENQKEVKKVYLQFKDYYQPYYIHNVSCVSKMLFRINNKWITIPDLLALVGAFFISYPNNTSNFPYIEKGKEIISYENLLKRIPGIILPPRPPEINKWLKESNKY